jgi:hypothetical protein
LGLNYFDPTDGRSVLLATVTNATRWLTASNEIVFSNCFAGIKASIRLRNTRSGLEDDVILHESPPDPVSLTLSTAARLEVLTEHLTGEAPSSRARFIQRERDPAKRAAMLAPDFMDTELHFGGMRMASGRAFATGNQTNTSIFPIRQPVGKSYQTIENRRILIEAVEHRRALPALQLLPVATNVMSWTNAAAAAPDNRRVAQLTRRLPILASRTETNGALASIRRVAALAKRQTGTLVAASSAVEAPAFVIDWQAVYGAPLSNFTFRGDTTYSVTDYAYLTGKITIEGGTVVKLAEYQSLSVDATASIVCDTTNYLPAVFTCYDDDSVGESLPYSTGTALQAAASGFYIFGATCEFRNVRFTHLAYPITVETSSEEVTLTLRNVQVLDATVGFEVGNVSVNVFNGLFKDCAYLYEGGEPIFRGEHITVHNATMLGYAYNSPSAASATIKNSFARWNYGPAGLRGRLHKCFHRKPKQRHRSF